MNKSYKFLSISALAAAAMITLPAAEVAADVNTDQGVQHFQQEGCGGCAGCGGHEGCEGCGGCGGHEEGCGGS